MVTLESRPIGVDQKCAQSEECEERINPPGIATRRFSEAAAL
jgi:hypothetical protein